MADRDHFWRIHRGSDSDPSDCPHCEPSNANKQEILDHHRISDKTAVSPNATSLHESAYHVWDNGRYYRANS